MSTSPTLSSLRDAALVATGLAAVLASFSIAREEFRNPRNVSAAAKAAPLGLSDPMPFGWISAVADGYVLTRPATEAEFSAGRVSVEAGYQGVIIAGDRPLAPTDPGYGGGSTYGRVARWTA